jgi:YD repeat-containing protein
MTVTDWNSDVTSYTYDDANRLVSVDLPNGVETTYAYDDGNRLTGIEHVLGMSTLASVDYTLDAVGNRTQRVDGAGTHTYVYDDLHRLTSVTYAGERTGPSTGAPVPARDAWTRRPARSSAASLRTDKAQRPGDAGSASVAHADAASAPGAQNAEPRPRVNCGAQAEGVGYRPPNARR